MQYCYLTKLGSARLPQAKANLPTLGCGEGKYSTYHVLQGTSQGEQAASALKASTPQWLSEKVFFRRQRLGWGLQFVDFLLIGWWWGYRLIFLELQSSTHPVKSGVQCLWSACSHHPPPRWESQILQNNSKLCVRLLCMPYEKELGLCFSFVSALHHFSN